ncbi:hypothetical protein HK104_007617 [Borealophlyctis nickersoniae]|nr:hypothetical protein HK104_007617 [Borealophlyctis nickersoniae]
MQTSTPSNEKDTSAPKEKDASSETKETHHPRLLPKRLSTLFHPGHRRKSVGGANEVDEKQHQKAEEPVPAARAGEADAGKEAKGGEEVKKDEVKLREKGKEREVPAGGGGGASGGVSAGEGAGPVAAAVTARESGVRPTAPTPKTPPTTTTTTTTPPVATTAAKPAPAAAQSPATSTPSEPIDHITVALPSPPPLPILPILDFPGATSPKSDMVDEPEPVIVSPVSNASFVFAAVEPEGGAGGAEKMKGVEIKLEALEERVSGVEREIACLMNGLQAARLSQFHLQSQLTGVRARVKYLESLLVRGGEKTGGGQMKE